MKMRRMLPGVLSVVLALSLAACGGVPRQGEASEASMAPPPSAFETLKRASDAMDALEGSDLNLDVNLKMSMPGTAMEIGVKGRVQTESSTKYRADITETVAGQEIPLSFYRDGAYTYTDMMGMKIKSLADDDPVEDALDFELKEEYFKKLELTEADGVRTLTISVDPDKALGLVKSLMNSDLMGSLGDMGIDTDTESENEPNLRVLGIELTAKLGQDNLIREASGTVSLVVAYEMPSVADPESAISSEMQLDVNMSMTINNPGQPVTVTPPVDLDQYTEAPGADAA